MSYTMAVCEGENNERTFQNPSAQMIDRAIDDLVPELHHFVILEAEPHIENCAYMQTLIPGDGKTKGQYLVEARYASTGDFKHYRKFVKDAGDVKSMFRAFAKGATPNVAGWEDVTDKIITPT